MGNIYRDAASSASVSTVMRTGALCMFTLLQTLSPKRLAAEQAPTLLAAWLIAEAFYKFHSFSLECAAFLVTWFAFDALVQLAKALARAIARSNVKPVSK
jgi:hypothetical protein